ncbi:MAG TPA: M14 family metallopeptidase [Erythrobacter sp.]|nr:M14 family metallopeptidase [Erythrobacter sp.]
MIAFDFDGASSSACAVTGERSFDVLVTPEHAPPINPSPWYAFRYEAQGDAPVIVTLRYLGAAHRYNPKWRSGAESRELPVTTGNDGARAMIELPPGQGVVSAQEVITPADARADLQRWAALAGTQVFTLGQSRDGRPVEAIRIGRADAPRLVILLGRQHPPEVTGAIAMQAFVDQLTGQGGELPEDLQFLIVPMLNPDGVVRGHWRANRGGIDLNRDWGDFSQPETRAVKGWLDALPPEVRPVLMIDFHSTGRNLFYVQGDEASPAQARFLAAWLGGRESAFAGWPFTIEPRNANPGSGTAKNWFFAAYAIPAYTYEVADTADRAATRAAAQALAASLPAALEVFAQ